MGKSVPARIAEFVEYHIHGDGECNNTVLKEWVRRRNLSLQERYELAYFFSVTYCVESAVVMFEERSRIFADIKGWVEENKARLVFQSDRKYIRMKDSFERVLRYFQNNLTDVRAFLAKVTDGGKIILSRAIPYVSGWDMFGRFSAFLFLETFVELTGTPIENTTIEWKNGNTATSGLLNVFGYDAAAKAFDKSGRLDLTPARMDEMLEYLKKAIEARGGTANVTEIETSLCAYRKFYKASRYNGYYLDRMLEEIYAMERDYPRASEELLSCRRATCDSKYLGEVGGWRGIRPERKKMYIQTGLII